MSNFDKIVKLACKPKNVPPKAKYVDQLVAATFSDDGSLSDVSKSLSLRLREPNAVIVFKALLTLHQMIRSGSTDQLLDNLCQGDVLKLRNVSNQNWEGYVPPSSMSTYAKYLNIRIFSFKEVKHDLVRVQTESNRRSDGLGGGSKARRLRHLPVDKGLLREVKQIQKVLNALVECKFYDDNLKEENTVLAFRMLVKDLLVLFQAGNEGVCNILEHYFEMSKIDATESFGIYKSFINQTDKVVDYLGVARKLHNVVNVPVPNLKHAPTSLVKALEEYLNDPNFEQNRLEYKKSLGVVESGASARTPSPNPPPAATEEVKPASGSGSASQPETQPAPTASQAPAATAAPPGASRKIQDFFDSIQADHQPTMFDGPAQQINYQQIAQPFNPFRQSMMLPQQTGYMPQQPGFLSSQMTGFPGSQGMPFLPPHQTAAMPFGHGFQQPQQPAGQNYMSPQQSGFAQPQAQQLQPTGVLQTHQTGANPFRQSMMMNTNVGPSSGAFSQPSSPFGSQNPQLQRPGSVPAGGQSPSKPFAAQSTDTRNPFAPSPGSVPAPQPQHPTGPSIQELAWNKAQSQFGAGAAQFGQHDQQNQANNGAANSPWGSMNGMPSSSGNGFSSANSAGTAMSDIASAFSSGPSDNNSSNDFMSQFGSLSVNGTGSTSPTSPSQFGSLSSNPTGASSASSGFIQPQATAYSGSTVKRFQPTSSFGSQLMGSLPPIHEPHSGSTSPAPNTGMQNQSTGLPFSSASQSQQQQPQNAFSGLGEFGQTQSQGQSNTLPAQQTGLPNPFRQSNMFDQSGGGGGGQFGSLGGGGMSGAGAFGGSSPFAGQNRPPQQGQQGQQGGQVPQGQGQMSGMGAFGGMFGQPQSQQQQGGSLI